MKSEVTEDSVDEFHMMENIPLSCVTWGITIKLANKLDPDNLPKGNNWKMLAEKLGYSTIEDIAVFESQQSQHGRNTIKVLQAYSQEKGSTVNDLYRALQEMERPDALDELKNGMPEIEKNYREIQKKKHTHKEMTENEFVCQSCNEMPFSAEPYKSSSPFHQKNMMAPLKFSGMIPNNHQMSMAQGSKYYQRHKSVEMSGSMGNHMPRYDHSSPEFKRQRSMPLSDSMIVRGHNNQSQYFHEMEPMDHSPTIHEEGIPGHIPMMRELARYNNQIGHSIMPSVSHASEVECFKHPHFRPGLKLEIPSPRENFQRQDFMSPGPTPETPSTPLGQLEKLAYERPFQPDAGYTDLIRMKQREEMIQNNKEAHLPQQSGSPEKAEVPVKDGSRHDDAIHTRLKSEPPNTYPLRLKSSCSTSSSPLSSTPQLTKSASLPNNMKPSEYRKAFRHIKVFVTYAADDKKHTQRVLNLCRCLEKNGFTCCVDIFHRKLKEEDRSNWCVRRFEEADFILVVMSPKYRIEADSCEGENDADISDSLDSDGENNQDYPPYRLHTKNIYRLMCREFAQNGQHGARIVPVLFHGMQRELIPDWMRQAYNKLVYVWPEQYKDLLWMLTKPENRVPEGIAPCVNRNIYNTLESNSASDSSELNLESD